MQIKTAKLPAGLFICFWTWFHCLFAIATPGYDSLTLSGEFNFKDSDQFQFFSGQMTFVPQVPQSDICFLLPFASSFDPEALAFSKRFQALSANRSRPHFEQGYLKLNEKKEIVYLAKDIIKVSNREGKSVTLAFRSRPPVISQTSGEDWIMDGFHPIPLLECPSLENPNPQTNKNLKIKGQFKTPEMWKIAGPRPEQYSDLSNSIFQIHGDRLALGLSKNYKLKRVLVKNQIVKIYYKDPGFLYFSKALEQAWVGIEDWLGKYPHKTLTIIETETVHDFNLPGIIALNLPRQAIFASFQKNTLNWNHWVLTQVLASQWLHTQLQGRTKNDRWILDGMVDFVAEKVLKHAVLHNNIFNSYESNFGLITFDYRQLQEATAILLSKEAPYTLLTNSKLQSTNLEKHPFHFVRQSLALRSAFLTVGETKTKQLLAEFSKDFRYRVIDPEKFIAWIFSKPLLGNRQKDKVTSILKSWWTRTDWPDFEIVDFETRPSIAGRWLTRVEYMQSSGPLSPIPVQINQVNGQQLLKIEDPFPQNQKTRILTLESSFEPNRARLDPGFLIFDMNRFNNSTEWNDVYFFPGNARTLYPSDYTVLWLPTASKLPGESLAFGVQSILFQYLHGNYQVGALYGVEDQTNSLEAKSESYFASQKVKLTSILQKDFRDDVLLSLNASKSRLFFDSPKVSLGLGIRHRDNLNTSSSDHQTGSINGSIEEDFLDKDCYLGFGAEYESTIGSSNIDYYKSLFSTKGRCRITPWLKVEQRFFRGYLKEKSLLIPENTRFRPNNIGQARIRIDQGLQNTSSIVSSNSDFFFPLPIPLPTNLMILTRRIQFRLFRDEGITPTIRYLSYGWGLRLPFGGDISGAGSLSFGRVNLLVTQWSAINKEISKKPRILFSLNSEI